MRHAWLPSLLLAGYGTAFAWTAFGGGLLVFDDHPGQMYRIAHVLAEGFAPWRLNPGWWAGYAELQFYPPGFSYLGALIHYASLARLDLAASYEAMLWITFLLPGISTYLLLARVLGSAWLALPGAFLALTLSGGSRSGIEEGMRWGLVAARLGFALLPLLALPLHRWTLGLKPPLSAPLLFAAIVIMHPAHAPAGVALMLLAAFRARGSRLTRLGHAAVLIGMGAGLTAFWLVPLVAHLAMALPLAWGDPTLMSISRRIVEQPLLLALAVASVLAWWATRRPGTSVWPSHWLTGLAPAMAVIIVIDAAVAHPLGLYWLPADRLLDSFLLALIISASIGVAALARGWSSLPQWTFALACIALCVGLSSWGRPDPTLSVWTHGWQNEWPKYDVVARRMRLTDLWQVLSKSPPGRVLFVRSGLPLEPRPDWRRPHSHVTALTPFHARRAILNGTFTHPSPVAGFFYLGSPDSRAITMLAEQRDGVSLFGQPLERLDARKFDELAERLRVSSVVALDEDSVKLGFLAGNPSFNGPSRVGPFLVYVARDAHPAPTRIAAQRWRLSVPAHADGPIGTGMAYSPLWRAEVDGHAVSTGRDDLGLVTVNLPAGGPVMVDLVHQPRNTERWGLALSGAAAAALAFLCVRRRVAGNGVRRRRIAQTSGS